MDIKTLLFILAISQSIAAIAMLLASRQVGIYEGFRAWTTSFVLTAACMLLISLRGMIPPLLSITIANTGLLLSLSLFHAGTRRFHRLPGISPLALDIIPIIVITCATIAMPPSPLGFLTPQRTIYFGIGHIIICLHAAFRPLFSIRGSFGQWIHGVSFVMLAAVALLRIGEASGLLPSGISVLILMEANIIVYVLAVTLQLTGCLLLCHERSLAVARKTADELASMRIIQQREEERHTIARDLHDDLAQGLTAVHLELGFLSRTVDAPELRERLVWAKEQVGDTIGMTRNILAELRSEILEELGFVEALRYLAGNLQLRSGIPCCCSIDVALGMISPTISTAVFRIAQEALNNVARHSKASCASLTVSTDDNILTLVVEDDGIGDNYDTTASSGKYGITGMRERATLCGGQLHISRREQGGTRVCASLPLAAERDNV